MEWIAKKNNFQLDIVGNLWLDLGFVNYQKR